MEDTIRAIHSKLMNCTDSHKSHGVKLVKCGDHQLQQRINYLMIPMVLVEFSVSLETTVDISKTHTSKLGPQAILDKFSRKSTNYCTYFASQDYEDTAALQEIIEFLRGSNSWFNLRYQRGRD